MPPKELLPTVFDAPWKAALESFLPEFLALCFPQVHALIDWSVAPVFLETELQQIAPTHQEPRRSVDKLVQVRLQDGREEWLLIHVEVQAQTEEQFARRMFVYFYRIGDRFGQRVISLAVLADDDPHWRPHCYHEELAGCVQHFEFPVFKVLECEEAEGTFERTGNLFALVVAAHQAALRTRRDAAERCEKRFGLVKYLYRRGLQREQVVKLFRVIEWLTRLPEEWELKFRERLVSFEQTEKPMTELLSVFEEKAMEKGREKGREEGREEGRKQGRQEGRQEGRRGAILAALEVRFGAVPSEARAKMEGLRDEEALTRAHRLAITASSVQSFLDQL